MSQITHPLKMKIAMINKDIKIQSAFYMGMFLAVSTLCLSACSITMPKQSSVTPHAGAKSKLVSSESTINYNIASNGHFGDITASSSRKDLIKLFGSKNVQDGDIAFEEGQTARGTIVFRNDDLKKIEITWKNKTLQSKPESVRILGEHSQWHLTNGFSLGTSLIDVERYNKLPFKLYGFDWDYGGFITCWQGGHMEKFNSKAHHLSIRFSYISPGNLSEKESQDISGDGELKSSNPILHKLNPYISEITLLMN